MNNSRLEIFVGYCGYGANMMEKTQVLPVEEHCSTYVSNAYLMGESRLSFLQTQSPPFHPLPLCNLLM